MKAPTDKNLLRFIGQQIKNARTNFGYSQQQLAEMLSISTQTMSNIETGKQGISVTTLRNCCNLLKISSDRFLFGEKIEEKDITLYLEHIKNLDSSYHSSLSNMMETQIKFISEMEHNRSQKNKE